MDEQIIGKMLLRTLRIKCRQIGKDPGYKTEELSYYLSVLLSRASSRTHGAFSSNDCLYQLLLQDFGTREELQKHLAERRAKYAGVSNAKLEELVLQGCRMEEKLLSHLMLMDQTSLETIGLKLQKNAALAGALSTYAQGIEESMKEFDFVEMLQKLRELYRRDKKRFTDHIQTAVRETNVAQQLIGHLQNMQTRFGKMMTEGDRLRFDRLLEICKKVNGYEDRIGFSAQATQLMEAYRELISLIEETENYLFKESTEMLLLSLDPNTGMHVLEKLDMEILDKINNLYADRTTSPQIMVVPNEQTISEDQNRIWLIVQNGNVNEKLQAAEDVIIELESYTEGVSVQASVKPGQGRLEAGIPVPVEVNINLEDRDSEDMRITIGWSVSYVKGVFFDKGELVKECVTEEGEAFDLQVGTVAALPKNVEYENPYTLPALGKGLSDKKMFFGRAQEFEKIYSTILKKDEADEDFIDGSAVIIYGQKKSGKTSLILQVKNYITSQETLRDRAIIIHFENLLDNCGNSEMLHAFKKNFYANLLTRFKNEVYSNHLDVLDMLDEADIEIPSLLKLSDPDIWPAVFENFFRQFAKLDQGRHTVVLFMDEFTTLCTTIVEKVDNDPANRALADIPRFIKTFSEFGFVQLIVGHEAMMRALDKLGALNHTSEFARTVEIGALDQEASIQLIKDPMKKVFGFDPYATELGKKAVERLLDLSGCHPAYLMRLCDRLFDYYISSECGHAQLLPTDVNKMVGKYIEALQIKDFDILLGEDGDDIDYLNTRDTYLFLRSAAKFAARNVLQGGAVENQQISRQLQETQGWDEMRFDRVRNLLEARHVISIIQGGRVRINTGLFVEFIRMKNEGLI